MTIPMLKNFFIIAFRNIKNKKTYSFINISGLSLGMAAVIIIVLFLKDELSYDRFHNNADNLYRIAWFSDDPQTRTPHPLAQAMVRDFPEVESAVSLTPLWGPGLTRQVFTVKKPGDDTWYEESEILGVDSTFFDVFSFKLIQGNEKEVLRRFGGMLISESAAKKFFGEEDPVGKFLMINNDSTLLQVEGVFADVPSNSHFYFHSLVSYVTLKAMEDPGDPYYTWADFGHFNYIRLRDKTNAAELESKLMPWVAGYLDWDEQTLEQLAITNRYLKLQPVVDIHLKSSIRWELEPNGNIGYVYIMASAAIFILIIASFNFMNLTTARSMERAGEIGVRKALGASRRSLNFQFLGESILLSLVAIILAGFMVEVTLPTFNAFIGKDLILDALQPSTGIALLLSGVGIGILSGLYPAAFLSSLKPMLIMKGKHTKSSGGRNIRKALVVLQFGISIFLIAGFSVIYRQLDYLHNKDLGFNNESVVIIPIKTEETRQRFEALQTAVKSIDGILSLSAASNIPGKDFNQNPIWLKEDPDHTVNVQQMMADYEVFETLGLELVEGRTFSRAVPSDAFNNFVLNERAAQSLNLDQPVGSQLVLDLDDTVIEGEVVGVVKDFHFQSLHQPIRPLVFQLIPAYNHALMRVDMNTFDKAMPEVESIWNEFDANFNFEFDFLDEMMGLQYDKETRMGIVFGSFAILAIVIACLGLAAIASIDFSAKKKDIGVRKVFGASSTRLAINLLKENTIIVLTAFVLAAPVWWLTMSNWLNNFNFRIDLDPLMYVVSGTILVVISWITLAYLTHTTVTENPVHSLRDE